ncbi:MAG TPA: hypothetical protein VMV06_01715 [Acidimicrobiales bacterium]|nr:hypothetical protein [Acidimicrobiales bacterium]
MAALLGLPSLPGGSCPSAAAALGAAGLGPVCQAASGVAGVAGSAASQLAGFGVDSVLNALGTWVADGAAWLLVQIGAVIGDTTGIDLGAPWFTTHYLTMAGLAGVVVVPLLLLGIIQSIYRQNASMLIRSVAVNVPLAVLLTAVAVKLVQLGLAVTDAMSAAVAHGAGLDAGHFMASVTLVLSGPQSGQPGVPAFILFLGSLAVVCGAVLVWVELLIRASAVYVAVLFLPLALASLAWPAIAHWCRRLVDTLVALILGKFVIVSVLSLAAGALAGGTGSTPAGAGGPAGSPGGGGGFGAVLAGAALLLLSALAPWALFRLLPFLEAGAVGHLEGLGQRARRPVVAPAKGLAFDAMRVATAGSFAGAAAGAATGALGNSLAGAVKGGLSATSTGASRAEGPGGTGPGGTGPGGTGPGGTGPDPGPSSAQATGVGTTESAGHDIPVWAAHPEATAAARYHLGEGAEEGAASGAAPGSPLPRQTGTLRADTLGRDELGVRLIGAWQGPGPPPDPRRPNPAGRADG